MEKYLISALVIGMLCFSSCRQNNNEEDATAERVKFFENQATRSNQRNIYYRFPSPEEVLRYIDKQDLSYQETLLLPADNRDSYISSAAQSVALGIYISDLAYVTLFKKRNQAVDYLETIKILSDALYIAPPKEEEIRDRVKNNLSDIDSLMAISKDSYNNLVNYLVESGNEKTLALISAGAYVEALFLVTQQIESFQTDDPLVKRTLEQKLAFENLYKYYAARVDSTAETAAIQTSLQRVTQYFSKVIITREDDSKMEKKNGSLVLTGGKTTVTMSESEFQALRNLLAETRNSFIALN